jgi:hypothetical protein
LVKMRWPFSVPFSRDRDAAETWKPRCVDFRKHSALAQFADNIGKSANWVWVVVALMAEISVTFEHVRIV